MTDVSENVPEEMGPIHDVREILAAYLQTHWPEKWPIIWQNMPAPDEVDDNQGVSWAQFNVMVERISPVDLGGIRRMVKGRLYIVATAPKDTGMTVIDDMADTISSLFSGQSINTVKIGTISLDHPRHDRGYVQMGITVTFTSFINKAA